MKDKSGGKIKTEFVALRPKICSSLMDLKDKHIMYALNKLTRLH